METHMIPTIELFEIGTLNNVALVTNPAIEEFFVSLSEDEKKVPLSEDEKKVQLAIADSEQRIVIGPALIPDKKIIRYDGETPYYIFFSKDTVRRIAEDFLREGKIKSFNVQHQEDTNELYVTESWIVENPELDKSNALGMSVPTGTWMLAAKVTSDEIWERVKSCELRGFSIDGLFTTESPTKEDYVLSQIIDILKEVE